MFKGTSVAILALGLAGAANAAEVERKVEVKADAAALWSKIGGWCAIGDFHPALAKCEESEAGGKKQRTLTIKDGAVIKETMTGSGAMSYSYRIDESPLPVADYTASFSVTEASGGSTIVWAAKFQPKGASEAEAEQVIQGIFDGGLDAIKKAQQQ